MAAAGRSRPRTTSRRRLTRDAPGSHCVHHDDDDGIGESSSSSPLFRGQSSRPKEGGSWDPSDPLRWCASFGTRSRENAIRLVSLVRLRPGDEGHFEVDDDDAFRPGGVTIVRTPEQAKIVVGALTRSKIADLDRIHACDTEVMDIDLGRWTHGQLGLSLTFPPLLFSYRPTGSTWLMHGVEFRSVPGLRVTSQNILWSTMKVNEACARPPHIR